MSNYVVVSTDVTDKVIKVGPIDWDGVSAVIVPQGAQFMLETDAVAGGYVYPAQSVTQVNSVTLRQHATAALSANGTYLAIPAPTAAQATVQVAALTRQVNALIRLTVSAFNTIAGT